MKYVCGIDVGINGAVALYCAEPLHCITFDMPTYELTINGKKKKRLDIVELARLIDNVATDISAAWIEDVGASPQMGTTSSFAFGFAAGVAQGIVAANFIPTTLVRPQVWKKHFGLNSDKDASRRKASSLFPEYASHWSRAKDADRAEALLIAVYGNQSLTK